MFKLKMGRTPNNLTDEQIESLAAATNNFTGADIDSLFKAALSVAIDRCVEDGDGAQAKLIYGDFESSLVGRNPSTNQEKLNLYLEYQHNN